MTTHDTDWDPSDDLDIPAKEEPNCGGCGDTGWIRPHRWWQRVAAQFAPLVWGYETGWNWRPRRGTWPCDSCNPSWVDWQRNRLADLRRRLPSWLTRSDRRARLGNVFDDEPPF